MEDEFPFQFGCILRFHVNLPRCIFKNPRVFVYKIYAQAISRFHPIQARFLRAKRPSKWLTTGELYEEPKQIDQNNTRWWFVIILMFTPTWGNGPSWLSNFQVWAHKVNHPQRTICNHELWLLRPEQQIEDVLRQSFWPGKPGCIDRIQCPQYGIDHRNGNRCRWTGGCRYDSGSHSQRHPEVHPAFSDGLCELRRQPGCFQPRRPGEWEHPGLDRPHGAFEQ